jgi:hypothetical protein
MNNKQEMITALRHVFQRWEALLDGMSEEQVNTPLAPSHLTIKDEIAHLRAWQMRSIARLEAALANREPVAPSWQTAPDPEAGEMLDKTNAGIYEAYRHHPWSAVHQDWRNGFHRFLELCEQVPEADLLAAGKYPWLEGDPLMGVLQGSYDHHREEHLEPLLEWLKHQGMKHGGT